MTRAAPLCRACRQRLAETARDYYPTVVLCDDCAIDALSIIDRADAAAESEGEGG